MFSKVLIANRGAIACRIIRTLKTMGVASVAMYSEADRHALHVLQADEAICIGPAPASQSYLDAERILQAALDSGAQAIHPGYGFLSENATFAERCEASGIAFVGPTPDQMRAFGLKHTARQIAADNEVPLLPGSGLLADLDDALIQAVGIGYPVMLKSTAGGGGIGMQLCQSASELRDAFATVQRLSRNNFADDGLFLEKFVARARHIEVQIFGDGQGQVLALGERDCSLQRRNQKVVEETPAPGISDDVRTALLETAARLGRGVNYRSAGTVEYIFDADSDQFWFLEVNTRLQVEHGVTEEVTGIDLVEWMLRTAAGEPLPLHGPPPKADGHAIQVRLYAEDPGLDFRPATGLLTEVRWPKALRVDTWVDAGTEVSPYYDPMLAKLIVHSTDRASACQQLSAALGQTRLYGVENNLDYLRQVIADPVFRDGKQTTSYLNQFRPVSHRVEILSPGTQTTVQDWPGRVGYWDIGVPPSGPMDSLSFRLGNRLLGNPEGVPGLELTVTGPVLKFRTDTRVLLAGAPMDATLDGVRVPWWQSVPVAAGQTLTIGSLTGSGTRGYLLVSGGFAVPDYLGSGATFTLGQFGGHGGRTLRTGDVLHLDQVPPETTPDADTTIIPNLSERLELRVVYGPHGAPDFFTEQDIDRFFDTAWEVHYNSSRTGVRLIGPKPEWAREDGGEAGLHPSNIHDNAYAIGAVDFTGDMPVILGPDGPSLGGFVSPATVISADLWKLGQLKAGDRLRFSRVSAEAADKLAKAQEAVIRTLRSDQTKLDRPEPAGASGTDTPLIDTRPAVADQVAVQYRYAGDCYILVEYGPMALDLNLRFRIQALLDWLQARSLPGIINLTPGVRSLQIHFDPSVLSRTRLMDQLAHAEDDLQDLSDAEMPSRIVHLPLAWDDSQTQLATQKYMQSVRRDAPWCPRNIEFIRRINGLDSEEAVKRIVFDAAYLVMGLGDVYLSAPLATPVDPRHRLVTTKYNPARTWTPENAVGIGGSYMCIYGMEGPGGYQFVGRTLQVWNRYHRTAAFEQPWLLRFFDQIRFYEVSEDELLQMRADFPRGRHQIEIEHTTFSLRRYNNFLAEQRDSIAAFKQRQQAAFEAERQRWIDNGQAHYQAAEAPPVVDSNEIELATGEVGADSPVQAVVWQLAVAEGDEVEAGQTLLILEFMKTETAVTAPVSGKVRRLLCQEGNAVAAGQTLAVILQSDGSKA